LAIIATVALATLTSGVEAGTRLPSARQSYTLPRTTSRAAADAAHARGHATASPTAMTTHPSSLHVRLIHASASCCYVFFCSLGAVCRSVREVALPSDAAAGLARQAALVARDYAMPFLPASSSLAAPMA